jgi:hypothetical protein
MRMAFKEWAVVVDALGRGDQTIILRKGGISEGRGGFQLEHERFLFFPTLFHQQRESVLPAARLHYDELAPKLSPSRVRIEFLAEVAGWKHIDSLEAAMRLRGQHVWRDDVIRERFDWGRSKSIYAMAVRVFRLAQPRELPMRPEFGGCKSWIDLGEAITVAEAQPVLAEPELQERLQQFRAALEPAAV